MGTSKKYPLILAALTSLLVLGSAATPALAATVQQSGSTGLNAVVPGPAPSQAPSIGVPSNGQGFSTIPITVSGLCQNGLLVEVFKNNVFSGSATCSGGSYSLQIDLFNDRNDLVARQYDALNQASPDSATVSVNYNNSVASSSAQVALSTQYSQRGADPGNILTWPVSISGGTGPYAISVDWGDNTAPELISLVGPTNFNIQHIYEQAGTYSVTVKATDINGTAAFLQLVGVGNGATQQNAAAAGSSGGGKSAAAPQKVVVWWPYVVLFVLAISTFWLGKKHQLELIRSRLRRGERPFK